MIAADDLSSWIVPFREQDPRLGLAIQFMPLDVRSDVEALYAFRHEVLRVIATVRDPMITQIRLQWWCDVLAGEREDEAKANPLARRLLLIVNRYGIKATSLVSMIEAFTSDLYYDPLSSTEELYAVLSEKHATLFRASERILNEARYRVDDTLATHAGLSVGFAQLVYTHRVSPDAISKMTKVAFEHLSGDALSKELRRHSQHHLKEARKLMRDVPKRMRMAYLPLVRLEKALKHMEVKHASRSGERSFGVKPIFVFQLWSAAVTGKI